MTVMTSNRALFSSAAKLSSACLPAGFTVDLFASNDLLVRYWQKLVRSYAAESVTTASTHNKADEKEAQAFLDRMKGNREVIETEPGVFRRAEVTGDSYKVFTLTALMPKTDFDVHIAKMTYDKEAKLKFPQGSLQY